MKRIILGAIVFSISISAVAETTNKTTISQVLYNGNVDFLYFIADSGWVVKDGSGNTLCSPYYVQIISSVPGRDKLLSIALAAKFAGAEVDFIGACATDPSYFNAYYIRVY